MRLYLASTSPARLAVLRAAGIEPVVCSSGVDERGVIAAIEAERGPLSAAELVETLAEAKAEAVAGRMVDGGPIDGFILGGDSVFEFDGCIYGKPHTAAVARDRWRRQRGGEGILWSGQCLIDHRGGVSHGRSSGVDSATVRFESEISDREIDAYIATGEPLNVAGAFTIDSLGAPLVAAISGAPSTVVGLSVPLLRRMLRDDFAVDWPTLWNR